VTSATIFASRKMAFTDLLGATAIFVNAVMGLSAPPAFAGPQRAIQDGLQLT
jgi:hypothetical protein